MELGDGRKMERSWRREKEEWSAKRGSTKMRGVRRDFDVLKHDTHL